jgi:hypothetical protein
MASASPASKLWAGSKSDVLCLVNNKVREVVGFY